MEFAKDPGLDNNAGANWCEGYLLFGDGDRGTPGEANHCCFSEACMYLEVDIATQETMRATLHQAIDDHVRFPYTSTATDTWDILKLADEDPSDDTRILDVYKNASYPKADGGNDDYDRDIDQVSSLIDTATTESPFYGPKSQPSRAPLLSSRPVASDWSHGLHSTD